MNKAPARVAQHNQHYNQHNQHNQPWPEKTDVRGHLFVLFVIASWVPSDSYPSLSQSTGSYKMERLSSCFSWSHKSHNRYAHAHTPQRHPTRCCCPSLLSQWEGTVAVSV